MFKKGKITPLETLNDAGFKALPKDVTFGVPIAEAFATTRLEPAFNIVPPEYAFVPDRVITPVPDRATEPPPTIGMDMVTLVDRLKFRLPLFQIADVTGPATALSYTADIPTGIMTFSTFDKSGTAPVAVVPVVVQFAGFDQLPPEFGPVYVTELSCVITPLEPA